MRILIVDDHDAMRSVLRRTIQSRTTFEVVGEAADGETAIRLVGELTPDVVIMDINMPGMSGIDATKAIKSQHPKVLVLACSVSDDDDSIQGMLDAGASGYIIKGDTITDLVYSLKTISHSQETQPQ